MLLHNAAIGSHIRKHKISLKDYKARFIMSTNKATENPNDIEDQEPLLKKLK